MQFDVYCDESHPDLFTSENRKHGRFLMIGSLWLPTSLRDDAKTKINSLREKHSAWGEIKWTKVSPSKIGFYNDLASLFVSYGADLRFRCIAVEAQHVNMELHGGDGELGFYKFYYQLLHHWIDDFNEYSIFCDIKTNRDPERLKVLKRCLSYANLSSKIKEIQFLPSKEVALIQFTDLLLGIASSRLNGTLTAGGAKERLVKHLETLIKVDQIKPTWRDERKFNVFQINLRGGW